MKQFTYIGTVPDGIAVCHTTNKDPQELLDSINADLNHITTQIKIRNLRINIDKTQFMAISGKAS